MLPSLSHPSFPSFSFLLSFLPLFFLSFFFVAGDRGRKLVRGVLSSRVLWMHVPCFIYRFPIASLLGPAYHSLLQVSWYLWVTCLSGVPWVRLSFSWSAAFFSCVFLVRASDTTSPSLLPFRRNGMAFLLSWWLPSHSFYCGIFNASILIFRVWGS